MPAEVNKKMTTAGPKSLCRCSHLGDGPGSEHEDTFEAGHGACRLCKCDKFTWARFVRRPDPREEADDGDP